jgi:hypothetical protein
VDIDGTAVPIKSLSRDEVLKLSRLEPDEAEVLMISSGASIPEEEAIAWRKAVTAEMAGDLLKAIAVLSGIRKPKPVDDEDEPGEA